MPKVVPEMSALKVNKLKDPGLHAVGGVAGLALNVSPSGARSWILRTVIEGKRRSIGLGGYPTIPLALARDLARETAQQIALGVDPVEKRKAERKERNEAKVKLVTFDDAFEVFYTEKMEAELSNAKHRQQWRSTIATYVSPVIGARPVAEVNVDDVLQILQPIWALKTETASRVRGRIEAVLDWAKAKGLRTEENSARWKGNLDMLLASPTRIKGARKQPALALDEASVWFALLHDRKGISALALQFLALTAARSGEVREASWSELNLEKGLWIVPAARMKMRREHRVPLSSVAVKLLKSVPRFPGVDVVFPSSRGKALSDMALSQVMRRINTTRTEAGLQAFQDPQSGEPAVPHGLRSTFRDWAAETTSYPSDMAELALAHSVGNRVEQAYRRGDMLEKRRDMMEDWAKFLSR